MITTLKKLLAFSSRRDRFHAGILVILMLVMGISEMISITLIMPFVAVAINPQTIFQSTKLHWLYQTLHSTSTQQFLIIMGSLTLLSVLVTNTLSIFVLKQIFSFTHNFSVSITTRLFKKYLHKPYSFFLQADSSLLSANLLGNSQALSAYILDPLMKMIARAFIILCIVTLLFIVKPMLAVTMFGIIGAAYAVMYGLTRGIMHKIDLRRHKAQQQRFQTCHESLRAVKEIKLYGRESFFTKLHSQYENAFSKADELYLSVEQMPRNIFEIIIFGGVVMIMLTLITLQHNTSHVMSLMAMYVFAAYRILPAVNQIFSSSASIIAHKQAVKAIYEDLIAEDGTPPTGHSSTAPTHPLSLQNRLELRNIDYCYLSAEKNALNNVSLSVPAKSTVAFVGKTGSGKTTLIDVILGFLTPQQGEIYIDDTLLGAENLTAWRKKLSYVPQHSYLLNDTITHNIAFGLNDDEIDHCAVKAAAQIAQLDEFVTTELPDGYATIVGESGIRLSGGQRQRISIARALYHNPEIIILDEATNALDALTEHKILSALQNKQPKKTMIIITHRLSTVHDCDKIFLLDKGSLVDQGTFEELLDRHELFRTMNITKSKDVFA